jgi:hypothetical protein
MRVNDLSATTPEVVRLFLEQGANPTATAQDIRGQDAVRTLLDTAPDTLLDLLDHFINKAEASLGADNHEGK